MLFVEIAITAAIVIAAGYVLYRNLKNKSKGGGCDCCSTVDCPYRRIKKEKVLTVFKIRTFLLCFLHFLDYIDTK